MNPYDAAMRPETFIESRPQSAASSWTTMAVSYAATVLSGGVFGIWAGPLGFAVGLVIAALVGLVVFTPAFAISCLIKKPLWLRVLATTTGGFTGAASVLIVFSAATFDPTVLAFAAAATFIGGAASGVAAWLCTSHSDDRY